MTSRKRKTSKHSRILEITLCIVVLSVAVAPDSVATEQGRTRQATDRPVTPGSLRLVSAEPTVLFVRGEEGLLQIAKVTIENAAEPIRAGLETKLDGKQGSIDIDLVNKGKTTVEAQIPDITEPAELEIVLTADGKICSSLKLTWQPQRHWAVFFVPITHHDLGYTDSIENTLI